MSQANHSPGSVLALVSPTRPSLPNFESKASNSGHVQVGVDLNAALNRRSKGPNRPARPTEHSRACRTELTPT